MGCFNFLEFLKRNVWFCRQKTLKMKMGIALMIEKSGKPRQGRLLTRTTLQVSMVLENCCEWVSELGRFTLLVGGSTIRVVLFGQPDLCAVDFHCYKKESMAYMEHAFLNKKKDVTLCHLMARQGHRNERRRTRVV